LDPHDLYIPANLPLFPNYPTMSVTEADNTVLQPLTNGDIIAAPGTKDEVYDASSDSKENFDLNGSLKEVLAPEPVGKATEIAVEVSLLILHCFVFSMAR
jgi:hypothetical protein